MLIEIGDHWQFDDFFGSHFENGGRVKMSLNAIFDEDPIAQSIPLDMILPRITSIHDKVK
jgi:hypothetical protein